MQGEMCIIGRRKKQTGGIRLKQTYYKRKKWAKKKCLEYLETIY